MVNELFRLDEINCYCVGMRSSSWKRRSCDISTIQNILRLSAIVRDTHRTAWLMLKKTCKVCCAKDKPGTVSEVKNFAPNFDFWLLLDDARIVVERIYTIASRCQMRHIQDLHSNTILSHGLQLTHSYRMLARLPAPILHTYILQFCSVFRLHLLAFLFFFLRFTIWNFENFIYIPISE